jgi:hypothetical protein
VTLPHTAHTEALVTGRGVRQWQGICWYRKTFDLPPEARDQRHCGLRRQSKRPMKSITLSGPGSLGCIRTPAPRQTDYAAGSRAHWQAGRPGRQFDARAQISPVPPLATFNGSKSSGDGLTCFHARHFLCPSGTDGGPLPPGVDGHFGCDRACRGQPGAGRLSSPGVTNIVQLRRLSFQGSNARYSIRLGDNAG